MTAVVLAKFTNYHRPAAHSQERWRASVDTQFEQCVDGLYGALTDPTRLPAAMGGVARLLDAPGASYIRTYPAGDVKALVCHGFDPSITQSFIEHYAPIDPAKEPMLRIAPGNWMQDDDAFDARYTKQPEYVVDFAPRAGIRWFRGTKLHQSADSAAFFSVLRPRDARPFDGDSLRLLDRFYPHMARVSRLLDELELLPPAAALSQAAAESLSTGLCVVTSRLRVVYANHSAMALLAAPGPLHLRLDALAGRSAGVQRQLQQAVALATAKPPQARSFSPNPETVLRQRLQVRVLPLDETVAMARGPGGPFALLFLSRGTSLLKRDELCQLFDLSPSEAELVRLLAQGLTPTLCAERRNVSLPTVRTQLKSIYAKAGVSSQAQLMSLVLVMPSVL